MMKSAYRTFLTGLLGFALALCLMTKTTSADVFKSGWVLDGAKSSLRYEVIEDEIATLSHTISDFEGTIDADGAAAISIDLASIDTQDDMINTQFRYILFETFKYPKAHISTKLDARLLAGLEALQVYYLDIKVQLELHGVQREVASEAVITILDDGTVSVASVDPVSIRAEDFRFSAGLKKLQEAHFTDGTPYAAVSYEFIFEALPHVESPGAVAEAGPTSTQKTLKSRSIKVEAKDVCLARLKELKPKKRLQFRRGSRQLESDSLIVLSEVVGAIRTCDELTVSVAGHTDDLGDEEYNKTLSQQRADHVTSYLVLLGLPQHRVYGEGFGETQPLAPNDTAENRSKNRRVEFSINEG